MSKSTASFIAYDLRPAKQIERRMIVDFVRGASACGVKLSEYRYVGMGGIRFVDFLMVYRYLGITSMVSLEQDDGIIARCRLNKPIGAIELFEGPSGEFFGAYEPISPEVIWLDNDWSIGKSVIDDVLAVGSKAVLGSFFFTTISGEPPRFLQQKSVDERLAYYKEELGEFGRELNRDDLQNSAFRTTVAHALLHSIIFAFAHRTDGTFLPILRVIYKDSMSMVTVGGVFAPTSAVGDYQREIYGAIPLLGKLADEAFYEIDTVNLTDTERRLFEFAVTSDDRRDELVAELISLGFEQSHIDSYSDLVRFMPRYVESYL
jgi:hypothetical protein